MMTLFEMLDSIKTRPELYLGSKSIFLLFAFLQGWISNADQSQNAELLRRFQKWIEEKYGLSTSHSWARIIEFYSSGPADALDQTFGLFKEFEKTLKQ